MSARILIVDDHEVIRQGVRSALSHARPEWGICGEASDGKQAIEAVQRLKPDVVILDVTMPTMSGLQAAPQIAKLDDCPHFDFHHARIRKILRKMCAPRS